MDVRRFLKDLLIIEVVGLIALTVTAIASYNLGSTHPYIMTLFRGCPFPKVMFNPEIPNAQDICAQAMTTYVSDYLAVIESYRISGFVVTLMLAIMVIITTYASYEYSNKRDFVRNSSNKLLFMVIIAVLIMCSLIGVVNAVSYASMSLEAVDMPFLYAVLVAVGAVMAYLGSRQ
jgi:membrane-associated HD superfamily phosphohydrolase